MERQKVKVFLLIVIWNICFESLEKMKGLENISLRKLNLRGHT